MDPFVVRNLSFGIQDSVISTTGVLIGVASAKFQRQHILVTGILLIIIEALSMAYGTFLSDENFLKASDKNYTTHQVLTYSFVMFVSYFIVGCVLLVPFALGVKHAQYWTMSLAGIILLALILKFEAKKETIVALYLVGALIMMISIGIGRLTQIA